MNREFIFVEEYREAIESLPRRIQGDVLIAIMEYGLDGSITEELKPIARSVFPFIKSKMDEYKKHQDEKNHISKVRSEAAKQMHKKQKKCKMDAKNNFAGCKTDAKQLCEPPTNIIPRAYTCACIPSSFPSLKEESLKDKEEGWNVVNIDSELFEKFYSLFPIESYVKVDAYVLESGKYKGGCLKLWNKLKTDADRLQAYNYALTHKYRLHLRSPYFYLLDKDWENGILNQIDIVSSQTMQLKGEDLSLVNEYLHKITR